MGVPWHKPIRMPGGFWPASPESPCDKSEIPHVAHIWDELAEPVMVRWEEELEPMRVKDVKIVTKWCKGAGHLRGSI